MQMRESTGIAGTQCHILMEIVQQLLHNLNQSICYPHSG